MNNDNDQMSLADETPRQEQTPGSILRKAREEAGLTQIAVGEALHLTAHYIKALESDEYDKLPGLTFVKGYLRSYARYLRTDVDAVLNCFEGHIGGLVDAGNRTQQVQRSRRRQDQALRWAIATSLILVLGVAAGWWFVSGEPEPQQLTSPASTAPQATPTAVPGASGARAVANNAPAATTRTPAAALDATAAARVNETLAAPSATVAENPAGNVAEIATQPSTTAPTETTSTGTEAATAAQVGDLAPLTAQLAEQPGVAVTAAETATSAIAGLAGQSSPEEALALAETGQENSALTETSSTNGARHLTLVNAGDDLLELSFSGSSWVEIDDGERVRLYNDMLRAGDVLTIQGAAPFYVLLGDATHVDVLLNSKAVDFAADIRADSTTRLVLDSKAADTGVIR